ncbi:Hypothetical predicted protein [Mytilus galloprovincialis]|uniref:B box-type domain-containing protein n=2 Tax=Mytilus galloprovincialis TaxID=29158 RepID=A0A8B6GQQ4_MYTGA|nr:Hypothetical predicted protein [Mytilus galloprovincialis]
MAKSSKSASTGEAQVRVSCHFCGGLGATWKCEECEVFMCSPCKDKIHGKLKSSGSHELVSIYDISMDTPASDEVESEVVTAIFNSYTTSVPVVSRLLCSNDYIVYILNKHKSMEYKFIKGKLLKASIRILETYDLPMFDFTLNKNDEVLFTNLSSEEESPVRMLSSGGINIVLDPKPMRLLALHVNKENELICGLREAGPPFPIHDFSVRQIAIFDIDYRRKVTLESDIKGRKLFSYPSCIRTDSKNVMYIVDSENSDWIGKLLAVARTGCVKFSYKGPPSLEEVRPKAVSITPKDNIILMDSINNALHVLNTKGILLALQFLDELDIENAITICIDYEGFLLIGCAGHNTENGKIHVVKIAEHFML